MNPEWSLDAVTALTNRCIGFVPELAARIVARYHPDVPSLRIVHDAAIDDAGQFRFQENRETGEFEPVGIIVNTMYCRTVHDLVYVLLHEIRHAHQFTSLGAEVLSAASTHRRFWTELGHTVEEDAAAWAVDQVRTIQPGRNRILNDKPYHQSLYRRHRLHRARFQVAWDL
jgi:hypothetical protein